MSERIAVILPVLNAGEDLDMTVNSIVEQNYELDNIYIIAVDFGSTDGSYEKLLSYGIKHMGVYKYGGDFTDQTMVALARSFLDHAAMDHIFFEICLFPGDVLYPDYLKVMMEKLAFYRERYPKQRATMIVSEVDIRSEDGCITHKKSLFDEETIMHIADCFENHLLKGYQTNVMCIGAALAVGRSRKFVTYNDRIWWNNVVLQNSENDVIYLPGRLSCIKERYYKDELKEILQRWESMLWFQRTDDQLLLSVNAAEESVAYYALWRAFVLEKKAEYKQAKECFRMATIVCPHVRESQVYEWLDQLIEDKQLQHREQIQQFFEEGKEMML